jgi:hypothetical protein
MHACTGYRKRRLSGPESFVFKTLNVVADSGDANIRSARAGGSAKAGQSQRSVMGFPKGRDETQAERFFSSIRKAAKNTDTPPRTSDNDGRPPPACILEPSVFGGDAENGFR